MKKNNNCGVPANIALLRVSKDFNDIIKLSELLDNFVRFVFIFYVWRVANGKVSFKKL